MLLNTNEKGKSNLSEKKNSLKHAGRYNPEEKSKELIQNIKKIREVREISYYILARQTISKEEQELLRFYRDCSLAKRHFLNIYVRMLEQFEEE